MRAPLKPVLLVLAVLLATVVAAAAVAFSAGTVRVRVVEKKPKGARIYLLLPAAVVPVGLRLLPERERQKMAAELGPLLPALQSASRELARCGDFTLAEVRDHGDHVSVRVSGGSLFLDVDSDEATVHLSVPLKLVARLAADLAPLPPERVALLEAR